MPGDWTGLAIVLCQELKVEHVDGPVVVQVCCGWGGCVVAHADRHRVELVDDIVVVDIPCQQADSGLSDGRAANQCNRALGGEETIGDGEQGIGPGRSREQEGAVRVGGYGCDEHSA